jgi:5-methylcytosine-specific restriction endonuclease McrA
MKAYAEKFYKSRTWQNTREAYCKSKKYLCEACLEKGIYTQGEIVHHIVPITESTIDNPDITLSWDNLRLLCRPCHERIHRRKPRRYTVDELGHIHTEETER